MSRIEHLDDPNAPRANSLVPAASAVVADKDGLILMHRRADNDLWSIPGGAMEVGETISETAVRETLEETGLMVTPLYIIGVYSNPSHVVEYADGEVRQQFSVCFACKVLAGAITAGNESKEVKFVRPEEIGQMPMSPSIRKRVADYLSGIKGGFEAPTT